MPRRKRVDTGVDLLDPSDRIKLDPDVAEKLEPQNLRTADQLQVAISQIRHAPPGGFMTGKQYSLPVAGSDYPEVLRYDRFYWQENLLVDFFSTPYDEWAKAKTDSDIQRKREYARSINTKYLAIVGSATLQEIAEALAA